MTLTSKILLISLSMIFFTILVFFMKYLVNHSLFKNSTSVPATLLHKNINFSSENSYYILVFQLYTGKRKIFKVKPHQYSQYDNGDKGILIYRDSEKKFINFKKKF